MKYFMLAVLVLSVVSGGIYVFKGQRIPYENKSPVVQEKIVKEVVDTLEHRVAEAISASSTEIEREAQEAYAKMRDQMLIEIERQVTKEYREEIEAREVELEEKEMSFQ